MGRGGNSLRGDPGSELRLGREEKEKREDNKIDEQNKKNVRHQIRIVFFLAGLEFLCKGGCVVALFSAQKEALFLFPSINKEELEHDFFV